MRMFHRKFSSSGHDGKKSGSEADGSNKTEQPSLRPNSKFTQ
jgi:hypothetical protein